MSGIIFSILSAVTKILFPYVPNYGSKGRDAVKTPFSIPFFSIQYNHQLPKSTVTIPFVTYHIPFVNYHSHLLLITKLPVT